MVKTVKNGRAGTLFVFIIFGVFTAAVLLVLILGISVYKNINEISADEYNERTCLSYVWTKVRSGDTAGNVYVGNMFGQNVLCIDEDYDDATYETVIYTYDGWVYELYSEKGSDFSPEDGQQVINTSSLAFEQLSGNLIRVTSGSGSALICLRSGEEYTLKGRAGDV